MRIRTDRGWQPANVTLASLGLARIVRAAEEEARKAEEELRKAEGELHLKPEGGPGETGKSRDNVEVEEIPAAEFERRASDAEREEAERVGALASGTDTPRVELGDGQRDPYDAMRKRTACLVM